MLERLLLSGAIACATLSGCSTPQRNEYIAEESTQEIADKTVTLLEQGKFAEAADCLKPYEDRSSATMAYLRAITTVAKAGPPDATNVFSYVAAGNHFEQFFNYLSASPGIITQVQQDIPQRLFQLDVYHEGKKGLRTFVRNPGKLWWWHLLTEEDQKKTLSNCYAILPAMELVEGHYGNCARALKIGKPHFLPGRRDRIRYALDRWYVHLVSESSKRPSDDPQRVALELHINDVERLCDILKEPQHKATLTVIEPPK